MVTIHRAHGLRFVIFLNDHEPAHVHVFGEGEAKINLTGAGGSPELVWADRMSRSDVRRAMRVANERRSEMLAKWKEIHERID